MRKTSEQTIFLRLDQLQVDADINGRIVYGDIYGLAVELMTKGLLLPLLVRRDGDKFVLINGHRRRRAFLLSSELRIEFINGRHHLFDGEQQMGQAPGPVHPEFSTERIACRVVPDSTPEAALLLLQFSCNSGKKFTALENMLHLSRILRCKISKQEIIASTGFSRTHINNALSLHQADKRVLELVERGRLSQRLALQVLKKLPPQDQLAMVEHAFSLSKRHGREKLMPKDFVWPEDRKKKKRPDVQAELFDDSTTPVEKRLSRLIARFGNSIVFPDDATRDRVTYLQLIAQYLNGKLSLPRLQKQIIGG